MGPFLSRKESSCSVDSPIFSCSIWFSCLVVGISSTFYTLVAIIKYYQASCWSLCILPIPFLIRNQMRRHLVKIEASSIFSPGHLRMILYTDGTRTIMNVIKIVFCREEVPVVTGRVILPLTLMKFSEKLRVQKLISTDFQTSLSKQKHHKIRHQPSFHY